MKTSQMKSEFIFWDEQWQEHTEQTSKQGGGAHGSTSPKANDSEESRG